MEAIVDILNELAKADPEGMAQIMEHRVLAPFGVVNHRDVIVTEIDGFLYYGALGILGGMVSRLAKADHRNVRLVAVYTDDEKRILSFYIREHAE